MKHNLITIALLLLTTLAGAQTKELEYTGLKPTFQTGARFDANLEVSLIPKTLKMTFQEEIRVNENFSHLQRSYTSADLEYKILPWLKIGAAYSFILNNSDEKRWNIRHRGSLYLTESLEAGRWTFSLRERLQATHRTDSVNTYQSPKTEISLKTRLKIDYDIPGNHLNPYISAETRFLLNGVRPSRFVYVESDGRWTNPQPEYSDIYLNRIRLKMGTGYKHSKKNEFDFYLIADLNYDLDIDFNSKGKQKKDKAAGIGYADYLFIKNSYFLGLGISYTFKL